MSHHPVKAFPLQQSLQVNQIKRVSSPVGPKRMLSQNRNSVSHIVADNSSITSPPADSYAQIKRSNSSSLLRKSQQQEVLQSQNKGIQSVKGEHFPVNTQSNAFIPTSAHKRTQSSTLVTSALGNKQKNFNNGSNIPSNNFQFTNDPNFGVMAKSASKWKNDYQNDISNQISSKNLQKQIPSSLINQRTPSLIPSNKSAIKGYSNLQSIDKLPKLETLIQFQQQQQQHQLQQQQMQANGVQRNVLYQSSNLLSNVKGQSKEQLKSKLQNDLFKDVDGINSGFSSITNAKNAFNHTNSSGFPTTQGAGPYPQTGPSININLQIKNVNIFSPNKLHQQPRQQNAQREQFEQQEEDGRVKQGGQMHSRNPTQMVTGFTDLRSISSPAHKQMNQSAQQTVLPSSKKASRHGRSNSRENNESSFQANVDFLDKYAVPYGKLQQKNKEQALEMINNKKQLASSCNDLKPNQSQQLQNYMPSKNNSLISKAILDSSTTTTTTTTTKAINTFTKTASEAFLNRIPSKQQKNLVSCHAVRSKPGALPGKPIKTNQDSYIIAQNFNGNKLKSFFSVCDGHGINGHLASQYVKRVLGPNIELFLKQQRIKESSKVNDQENQLISQSLASGFYKTSQNLLDSGIDVTFSGSTCVSVYVTPESYWCANIGDSRAIVGRYDPKSNLWSNQPLSIDHKPDLQSEYERIIQSGGRVDSFKDQDGNPIGPARVWIKHENIPGLAMSRSFGDYVASTVGVISEPEVLRFDVTPFDRFLAIASDGVWEFLSNEDVVQMIIPFFQKNDPDGACDKIVKESVAAWKREDEVIDDITIIVVFLTQ